MENYLYEGIKGIVSHGRIGFKPSLISKEEHKKIGHKLNQIKVARKCHILKNKVAMTAFKKTSVK